MKKLWRSFPKLLPALCAPLFAMLLPASAFAADDTKLWKAGNYTFSDELGGFTIRSVAGSGSRSDPVIVVHELNSGSPVTLTIRAALGGAPTQQGNLASSALHLKMIVINGSGQAWVEFEFELQEVLHRPSIFSDGLSFDQRRENQDGITSSVFGHYKRDFEPYDRLLFNEGKVDPGGTAEFSFALTDFTPRWTFYIVEDPRIPFS